MYFFYYSLRPMDTSPIFCVAKHPVILRDTAGRRVIVTLRLNSPRPFSSVSLATSPPDKGGIGVCAFACILIPSPFSPYCYRNFPQCYETRQGGGWEVFHFLPCFYFKCDTLSCYSCGNIGEWLDSNSSVKVRRGSQTNFIKERAVSNSVWSNDTALPF